LLCGGWVVNGVLICGVVRAVFGHWICCGLLSGRVLVVWRVVCCAVWWCLCYCGCVRKLCLCLVAGLPCCVWKSLLYYVFGLLLFSILAKKPLVSNRTTEIFPKKNILLFCLRALKSDFLFSDLWVLLINFLINILSCFFITFHVKLF